MRRTQLLAIGLLAIALKLVIGGCSNNGGNPGSDGGNNDDLATGGSTDLATGGSTDLATSGGATCASVAAATCTQLNNCSPNIFKLAYENMTICNAVLTKSCMDDKTAGDNGVMDAQGCITAITASCDAWFSNQKTTITQCKRKLGAVPDAGKCFFDSQCGAGEYCYFNAGCGICQQGSQSGNSCTTTHDCDIDTGLKCAATFVAGTGGAPPTSDGSNVCQTVTLGAANAACVDGTNMACANGFQCANNKCTAVLATGAPCDGASATLCDQRIGDSCQPDPATPANHVCTPIHVVNASAQCGAVGTPAVTYICSGYAICGGGPPTVCSLRVQQGQPCTTTPDNCYPGLTCMGGTCQPPTPVTCP